jgi:spore protease
MIAQVGGEKQDFFLLCLRLVLRVYTFFTGFWQGGCNLEKQNVPIACTDMADELFGRTEHAPTGVRLFTARAGGVTVTRVEITRDDLAKPRGRYVTLDVPAVSILDERDESVIEAAARELRALLPAKGAVLAVGVGNRRVTADALGPRTVHKILATMGPAGGIPLPGLREVAAIAPGVTAATGVPLGELMAALVCQLKPAAVLCIDSLCSSEPERLGRTIQLSDTGLCPAEPASPRCLTPRKLGVPVIAVGIPTLSDAKESKALVIVPRELDAVISHGAALLGTAINRALQPNFSISQLCYLAN